MTGFVATSAEVSRNFGEWQDRAMTTPVQITHHGRPRAVLLSVEAYERLLGGAEGPLGDAEATELAHALKAVLSGMGEGFIAVDAALRVTGVNAGIEAFLGRAESQLVGLPFVALDPANPANDVVVDRLRWVLRAGEPIRFQARTELGGAGLRILQLNAFPYRGGVGITYRNITQFEALKEELVEVRSEREALAAQCGVAIAAVNPMGFFVRANTAACKQFGFDETRLRDVRFADLVRPAQRGPLLEGMNRVISRREPCFAADVEFLCREGAARPAYLSVAPALREENCIGLALAWQVAMAA
jgi:prevent-host-death family protein